jgi:hypothetical protein
LSRGREDRECDQRKRLVLAELALQENTLKGLWEGTNTSLDERGDFKDIEKILKRKKDEAVETLKTLV